MNTCIHMHAHGNICRKVHEDQLLGCQQLPFLNPLPQASGLSWFGRWPEQHEPAHQCACSHTFHLIPSPGKCAWSHPRYSPEKPPVRLCFPKLVFSASTPYFISVSHWLLCVIFDTLLWGLFFYVIPWSVKNSLFSRRSCSYPAVFLFSLKLRESLQLQGKMKNKSRNNIPAEMYLGGPIPPMQWPQQCNFRSCGSFYLLHPNTLC